jgi:hypothetical protein
MNTIVGAPEIGQWYRHLDKSETFQVVGYDSEAATIEIQTFDGDIDEIDAGDWDEMPLARAEPPEDVRGAMDDVESADLGDSDYQSPQPNLTQPPEPLGIEAWDDTRPGDGEAPEE